jgi:glycine oxidase
VRTADVDVAVVGGGVIGLTLAWRLKQRGASVVVVDRGEPGGEASWAAAGILSAQAEAKGPGPLFDLLWRSEQLFPEFVAELEKSSGLSCGFRRTGALHLGGSLEEMVALAEQRRWQQAEGLPVEAWEAATLREAEPGLASSFLGANHFAASAQVEPRRLTAALRRVLETAGVRLERGEVQALLREGDRVTGLRVDGSFLASRRVVLAAGAWSSLLEGTGLATDAIVPVRGQLIRFPRSAVRRIVFAHDGYLLPFGESATVAGSTMEDAGFARGVTDAAIADLTARARAICPGLAQVEPSEAWSGLRPATRDGLPALGATPIEGLHLAVGHYRNGILLAPLTAALVAEALLPGSPQVPDPGRGPGPLEIPAPVAAARLYA